MHYLLIITLLLPVLYLAQPQPQNPNFEEWKRAVGKKYGGNSE